MTEIATAWIVLLVGSLVVGVAFVGLLVVRRSLEPLVGLFGVVGFAAAAWSFSSIGDMYGRMDAAIYALAFEVAGIAGGYALASSLLPSLAGRTPPLDAPEPPASPLPDTAVIVMSCVEPDSYDPFVTADMLESLAEEGLFEPTLGAYPFLFLAQKSRYRAVGGQSPASGQLAALAERLETSLADSRITRVDWAVCGGRRSLATRVAAAVEAGYRAIVVAEVAVGESLHLDQAKREVDALRLRELDVDVRYTEPLWGAERIAALLASRVMAGTVEPRTTGVVLVGHGQPEERARTNPALDEQETAFLNRVRLLLVERGIPEGNVRIAWAEWNTPDVTSAVRHVAALGCQRIAVVPATYPLDTITTRLDLQVGVRQARIDEAVAIVTLPAWKDDEAVVETLRSQVKVLVDEMDRG